MRPEPLFANVTGNRAEAAGGRFGRIDVAAQSRVVEMDVVEGVERHCSHFQLQGFVNFELLVRGHVEAVPARTGDLVPSDAPRRPIRSAVHLNPIRGTSECRGVQVARDSRFRQIVLARSIRILALYKRCVAGPGTAGRELRTGKVARRVLNAADGSPAADVGPEAALKRSRSDRISSRR